jgi:hypothetical protein
MEKKSINELTAVSKFIDAFFTGLRNNTASRFLSKAEQSGVEPEIVTKMKEIDKQNKELRELIRKYSK